MAVLKRKPQESAIVAGSGGPGQLVKVTVIQVDGEEVTLRFDVEPGVVVQTGEEWASAQAAKARLGADRPKERAAYSD